MSSAAAYSPGSWVAVGAEAGWLLVDIDPNDPIVLKAWSLLRGGAEVDEILDAVLERGLRAVRSFALVRVSGDRRAVVVRGAAEATVTVDGKDEPISPQGVATWREYPLPAEATAVQLRAGDSAGDGAEQPLAPGVTLASGLRLAISDQPLPPRTDRPSPPAPPTEAPPAEAPAATAAFNGSGPGSGGNPEPPAPAPSAPAVEPQPTDAAAEPAPSAAAEPPAAEPEPAEQAGLPAAEPGTSPADLWPDPEAGAIPWLNPSPAQDGPPPPPPPPPGPPAEPGFAPGPPPEVQPEAAPPQGTPPPGSEGDPDSMAWLSAVKPLGPPSDDSQPYRLGPPTGIVTGGGGIGPDGPPPPNAAPPPAQPGPPPGQPPGQPQGQPQGQPGQQGWTPPPADSPDSTVSRASLMEQGAAPAGNMVQAVKCQHGHLSPPMAVSCRVCGFPLMGQAPITVPRPTLGLLRLSTGDVVPLDRTVIMGRNPKADETNEPERPHVVRLPSPGHDISRTHVEIRLDGWHVLLTDLNSVNGTVVTPPWQEPQRLRPNEAVPIEPGTVVSLADEVTFRYEVTG